MTNNTKFLTVIHELQIIATIATSAVDRKIEENPDATHLECNVEVLSKISELIKMQADLIKRLTEENAQMSDGIDKIIDSLTP